MQFLTASTTSGTASILSGYVSSGVESVWTIALLAASIPLAFYLLHALIGLFPKHRGHRR